MHKLKNMKRIFATIAVVICVTTFATAQTAPNNVDASSTTQTVNAAEMQKTDAIKCTTTSKSCCSAQSRADMNCSTASSESTSAGSELSKSASSCHEVSFGMSAEKPKKEEKTEDPQQ